MHLGGVLGDGALVTQVHFTVLHGLLATVSIVVVEEGGLLVLLIGILLLLEIV